MHDNMCQQIQPLIDIISNSKVGEGINSISITKKKGSAMIFGKHTLYAYQEAEVILHSNAYGGISVQEWTKLESLLENAISNKDKLGIPNDTEFGIQPERNRIEITYSYQ